MFQIASELFLAGLIVWGFLYAIFWLKNKTKGATHGGNRHQRR